METFVISLALTLAFELPVALLWGLRGRALALIALTNVLTNPLAVALHTALGIPQLPIELAVFLAEAMIYRSFSRTPGWRVPRPVMLSLASNAASWGLGWIISHG